MRIHVTLTPDGAAAVFSTWRAADEEEVLKACPRAGRPMSFEEAKAEIARLRGLRIDTTISADARAKGLP